jgi:hypothetical protein
MLLINVKKLAREWDSSSPIEGPLSGAEKGTTCEFNLVAFGEHSG